MKKLCVKKSGQAAVELAIFGSLILLVFSVLLMYGQRLDNQQQVKMEAFRRALQKAYERNGSVNYTLKKEGRTFNLFSGFGQGQPSTVASTASVLWQKGMPGVKADVDNPNYGQRSEGFAYYAINDMEVGSSDEKGLPRYVKIQKNITGADSEVWVTPSVYSEDQVRTESYSGAVKKEESPSGRIVNTRSSQLQDTIKTTLRVRVDQSYDENVHDHETPLPRYVYGGQSYTCHDGKCSGAVSTLPEVALGAYATEDNRVSYSPDNVGTIIRRERSWQTDY